MTALCENTARRTLVRKVTSIDKNRCLSPITITLARSGISAFIFCENQKVYKRNGKYEERVPAADANRSITQYQMNGLTEHREYTSSDLPAIPRDCPHFSTAIKRTTSVTGTTRPTEVETHTHMHIHARTHINILTSSIGTGATFSPPAVIRSSFIRPVIVRKPGKEHKTKQVAQYVTQ